MVLRPNEGQFFAAFSPFANLSETVIVGRLPPWPSIQTPASMGWGDGPWDLFK